jgi:hypothetical protein
MVYLMNTNYILSIILLSWKFKKKYFYFELIIIKSLIRLNKYELNKRWIFSWLSIIYYFLLFSSHFYTRLNLCRNDN